MTEKAKQAVKEEAEDELDGLISALNRKSLKKKEPRSLNELDDDDVPLSFSKAKKKKPLNPLKTRKEESQDDDDEKPLKKMEGLKKRPSNSPKVNKVEPEDDEDEKPLKKEAVSKKISKPKSLKKEVLMDSEDEEGGKSKKRKRTEEKKNVVKVKKVEVSQEKLNINKKEKKVYELPGQKHDPPEMRDPLRIFYETLYEKVPTSEMAAIWMMERGLLSLEEAQKVYAKKLRKNHNQKFGSPAKVSTPVKKSSTISVKKKVKVTSKELVKTTKKKVIDSEDDDDDDFVLRKLSNKKVSGR